MHSPEEAAQRFAKFIYKTFDLPVEIIYQDDYLNQGREHCKHSPFAIVSDFGGLVSVSLSDEMFNLQNILGYWCEPWDDTELCFYPTDINFEKQYADKAKIVKRLPDPECQADYGRALRILSKLPVVGYEEGGVHQFTWIRMRKFFNDSRGNVTREAIIDSDPHRIEDLEMAFDKIRKLKCVANIWYNLD